MLEPQDLLANLNKLLPPPKLKLLEEASNAARQLGIAIYLVGGAVRDLLLGLPVQDIDLVVVGDAAALLSTLAASLGGRITARSQFGTAKLRALEQNLDIVRARRETYRRPGALPSVHPGIIQDDLARRDFTINAMALRVEPPPPLVLDPTRGLQDLRQGLIRILHPASFQDDATRILRAIRYEQRLGFHLERETEALLRRDLGFMNTIGGDRLRRELNLLFQEERAGLTILRASELGALSALYPPMPDAQEMKKRLDRLSSGNGPPESMHLLAMLAYSWEPVQREGFIQRLRLPGAWARVVRDVGAARHAADSLAAEESPAAVALKLRDLSPEAVQAAAALAPQEGSRRNLQRYLRQWRTVRPLLSGRDLARMGIPKGPQMGQLLETLLHARLEGLVQTREDEEAFIRQRSSPLIP